MNHKKLNDNYWGGLYSHLYEYITEIDYEELLYLFTHYDDREDTYKLEPEEQEALDIMVHWLCYKYKKCRDFEKEDPYEDFRPML